MMHFILGSKALILKVYHSRKWLKYFSNIFFKLIKKYGLETIYNVLAVLKIIMF